MPRIHSQGTEKNLIETWESLLDLEKLACDIGTSDLLDGNFARFASKERGEREELEEKRAQGKDIRCRSQLLSGVGLFRRQVLQLNPKASRRCTRKGKRGTNERAISQKHLSLGVHPACSGTEPKMEHVLGPRTPTGATMESLQPVANLGGDVEENVLRKGSVVFSSVLQDLVQTDAFGALFNHEPFVSGLHPVKHREQERVLEPLEITDTGLDGGEPRTILQNRRKNSAHTNRLWGGSCEASLESFGNCSNPHFLSESQRA
jgi:hypothetical protein